MAASPRFAASLANAQKDLAARAHTRYCSAPAAAASCSYSSESEEEDAPCLPSCSSSSSPSSSRRGTMGRLQATRTRSGTEQPLALKRHSLSNWVSANATSKSVGRSRVGSRLPPCRDSAGAPAFSHSDHLTRSASPQTILTVLVCLLLPSPCFACERPFEPILPNETPLTPLSPTLPLPPLAYGRHANDGQTPSEYRLGQPNNGKGPATEQPLSPTLPAEGFPESTVMATSPSACSSCSSNDSNASKDQLFGSSDDDGYSTPGSSASSFMDVDTEPSSCGTSSEDLPADCFPSKASQALPRPSAWRRRSTPFTFPGPTPTNKLGLNDLESCLRFTNAAGNLSDPAHCAPPAFFPLQRVSFAPQLKVKTPGGVPLAIGAAGKVGARDGIAGMMLGVTGVIEVLDADKSRKQGK